MRWTAPTRFGPREERTRASDRDRSPGPAVKTAALSEMSRWVTLRHQVSRPRRRNLLRIADAAVHGAAPPVRKGITGIAGPNDAIGQKKTLISPCRGSLTSAFAQAYT